MASLLRDRPATTAAMRAIFDDTATLAAALRFEVALAEALAAEGLIPHAAAAAIRAICTDPVIDIAMLAEHAAHAGTLAIPLVALLRDRADPAVAPLIHLGATSQDLADTALMLQAKAGIDLLGRDLAALAAAAGALAERHAGLPMLGRTLLQPALPITFGLKAAQWRCAIDAARTRVTQEARSALALQFGGAAGTRAGLSGHGAAIAARMAAALGLANPVLPWHARRDGVAGIAASLAIATGAVGKIARDIALLAQAEVAEAFEPRVAGRGGSSAMAHKRNPTGCQVALSASLRAPGLAATILGAMTQEHERGLGGWQVEAAVLAELFGLAHGATAAMLAVVAGLEIDEARMRQNLAAASVGDDLGDSEAMAKASGPHPSDPAGARGATPGEGVWGPMAPAGTRGSAPALLLLHSLGCSPSMWTPQHPLSADFRLILPDLHGHASLDQLGAAALSALDHAGIERAHVCGISMGGLIAQWLALNAPQRVVRVVLANTAARIGTSAAWQERADHVRRHGMAAIADFVLGRFFGAAFTAANPDLVARFRSQLMTMNPHAYAACCDALGDADLTADVAQITSPTLVIAGSSDLSTPPDLAQALAAAIPRARLLTLPAAHLSSVEQPHSFTGALADHLLAGAFHG